MESIQLLLNEVQSVNNEIRIGAENQLSDLFKNDPSNSSNIFINIAINQEFPLEIRQSCLLYLKKIVPVFWSAGFQSFTGPAINGEVKESIRSNLLKLISTDVDSKIRNSAIYCVVQIAAVDFPDEWPSLLETIYMGMLSGNEVSLIGGLQLLQDIFDDLITEELFFDRGIGITTIQHCLKILNNGDNYEIKNLSAKLYNSCLLQLQNPLVLEDDSKIESLKPHFVEISQLLIKLLSIEVTQNSFDFQLRTSIYVIISTLTEFPEVLIPIEFIEKIHYLLINDLIQISQIYIDNCVLKSNFNEILKNLITELYQLLTTIMSTNTIDSIHLNSSLEYFGESILATAFIPIDTEIDYLADFNTFVVEETGLSPDYTVRNSIFEFLTEINELEFNELKNWIWTKLTSFNDDEIDWRSKEAILYLFKCISSSDLPLSDINGINSDLVLKTLTDFIFMLSDLEKSICDETASENLIKARIVDILPNYLSKFKPLFPNFDSVIVTLLENLLNLISSSNSSLLKVSLLNSLHPFNSLLGFELTAKKDFSLSSEVYNKIFKIINDLLEESTDDTPALLSSALTISFKLHEHTIEDLNLLIKIVSKDPSNIQLILEIEESLESLFDGISNIKFNEYLNNLLPNLINTIQIEGLNKNGEFSTLLNLSLQILNIFIYSLPHKTSEDGFEPINEKQFNLIFESISMLISISNDDQILQICGEIYNNLLVKIPNSNWFNLEIVLKVLSKFFNPELSDSAILNVGSLVVSILTRFTNSSNQISDEILSEILEATTKRLLKTENISTIENFLNVLCFMISINIKQTLIFLNNFKILKEILNIWFKNFDILKGHERIKLNCESLMKIYFFINEDEENLIKDLKIDGDELINNFNDDVIITRSMKKTLQYEQIPVYLKIVKLLVTELNNQIVGNEDFDEDHHTHTHAHDEDEVVEDDDAWEDVEEIENDFEKLKSYIGVNENEDNQSNDLKILLINFFKKIASENILNFKDIYENYLNDQQRHLLTENIV